MAPPERLGDVVTVFGRMPVLEALLRLKPAAASIDIAKLLIRFRTEGDGRSLEDFLHDSLAPVVDGHERARAREVADEGRPVRHYLPRCH